MYEFPKDAACADEDPELFFPVGTPRAPLYEREVAKAKAVCARCPVRLECLRFALDNGLTDGIFGGVTEHERAVLHRDLPARAPAA